MSSLQPLLYHANRVREIFTAFRLRLVVCYIGSNWIVFFAAMHFKVWRVSARPDMSSRPC
jgi:hypothetical protein